MPLVERVAAHSGIGAITPEWEALERDLTPRVPFSSPLWCSLWWTHLSTRSAWLRDELFIHTVRDEGGRLLGIAPMMLSTRPAFGPLRVTELQFLGADENLTELRGVICRTADEATVYRALIEQLLKSARSWDALKWCGVPAEGPARQILEAAGPVHWDPPLPHHYLPLPASWEAFRTGLSRNMKEAVRKCYNSPARAGARIELSIASRPEDVPTALATFFELHAERATAPQQPAHPNVFARPEARAFLGEYALGMAQRDALRIFQLCIDGAVVASRIGFVLDRDLYLYYSGYRIAWGRHSVMTRVVCEAIQWAIAQGLRGVDLSTGSDPSKTRWRPLELATLAGSQYSPRRLGQLAAGAYHRLSDRTREHSLIARILGPARRIKR